MTLTRRGFAASAAATAATLATPGIVRAQAEPIRIGWLVTLTGPLSSPGAGFDRGVR